ncbi:diguanylate cyclase [Pseudokineococcus basanitobsidens]|uniref:Diguanylate cyclase n=1 Tax=Pseudokineococcus basanitobsidens TaxID=1926649 RepID=A0ABU8RNI5_9ACTN
METVPPRAHRPASSALARSAAFAGLFALAVLLGRLTVMDGTSLSLVWPAAGVAATWFAVQRGARTLPVDVAALVAVTVVLNTATGATPALAVGFAVANLVQVAVVHVLLARWAPQLWGAGGREPLTGTQQLGALLGASLLGSAAGAALGVTAIGLTGGGWSPLAAAVYLIRNTVSVLLLLGAGLRVGYLVAARRRAAAGERSGRPQPVALPLRPLGRTGAGELVLLLLVSGVAYVLIFDVLQTLPIAFPLLVLTVWAALRFDTTVVALHGLAVGVVAVAFTLAGDGPFAFVASDAVRALIVQAFVGVVAVLGMVLALGRDERQVLMHQVCRQAEDAQERAEHVQVLARAARLLHTTEDVRGAVCRAAREITGADLVHLLEPDGVGNLATTATADDVPSAAVFPLDGEESLTVRAFRSGRPAFVADVRGSAQMSSRARSLAGVASGAWQPVLARGEEPVGVLALVWHEHRDALPAHVPPMLETLASEAAAAVEREDLLRRLAAAADRDPLTGLANRRRWDERTAAEVARATRSGEPLALAIVDLDHFKRYNDSHGHLAGDELLRVFACAAQTHLRDGDVLARWGGEEFALALPGCTVDEAAAVARRVHASVPSGQTCTVGVAAWQPGDTVEAVMRRADRALYEGKAQGRDRTVVAPSPERLDAAPRLLQRS